MAILLDDALSDAVLHVIQSSDAPLETEEIMKALPRLPKGVTRTKVMYRLHNLRAEGKIYGKLVGGGKGTWVWWSKR